MTVHLIILRACLWFRAALAWPQPALGGALDRGQKSIVSQRSADALGTAQTRQHVAIRLGSEHAKRGKRARMGARAVIPSSFPVRCARVLDRRRCEMILVHRDGAEPTLPEMAGAPAPRMNDTGIAAVDARQRPAQPPASDGTRMRCTWLGIKHQAHTSTPAARQCSASRSR